MEMPVDAVSLTILGAFLFAMAVVIYSEWRLQRQDKRAAEQSERRERKAKGEE